MNNASKILLIDDDDDDRFLFTEAVRELDKKIVCACASNGEDALKLLRKDTLGNPDYIFLDLNMPRMDGRQFLLEIKKIKRLLLVPVIIYTTSKAEKDIDETRKLGACYFITKPNKFSDLKKAIALAMTTVNEFNGKATR